MNSKIIRKREVKINSKFEILLKNIAKVNEIKY